MSISAKAGPSQPAQSSHAKSVFRNTLRGEDAYARHRRYVREYVDVYQPRHGPGPGKGFEQERKTDFDVLKAAHRDENEDLTRLEYADQLAVKYYSSLFKEFVICDLKHYKSGSIALRWRTDNEVIDGIGQFTCANPRCAHHLPTRSPPPSLSPDSGHSRHTGSRAPRMPCLRAYELPFAYLEEGELKNALVKAVLCERCRGRLVWKREREGERREREGGGGVREPARGPQQEGDEDGDEEGEEHGQEEADDEEDEYAPARPPDLHRQGRSRSPARRQNGEDRHSRRRRSLS
ncbi:hypothetical protein CALVIDRAFT_524876 [Calocera viscosa TUFC12733]|uniref:Protein FRA10AC1 n=1 Tax=Calocera viscosa (strain TUFC12733) TaxID=1330018 RepID=A0A167R5Q3_CALVF|nr:hypothetical protein CALVIDRAFT_524876 [Calocera viscosa TUFC12733]